MAQLLLECGAGIDALDADGKPPLYLACGWGRGEVAQLLLDRGASTGAVLLDQEALLANAQHNEYKQVAEILQKL